MKFVEVSNNKYDIVLLNTGVIRTIEKVVHGMKDRAIITDITDHEYLSLHSYADFMKEIENDKTQKKED